MNVAYKNGLPQVPKGWRKLHLDDVLQESDMCINNGEWRPTMCAGKRIRDVNTAIHLYIRRKKGK